MIGEVSCTDSENFEWLGPVVSDQMEQCWAMRLSLTGGWQSVVTSEYSVVSGDVIRRVLLSSTFFVRDCHADAFTRSTSVVTKRRDCEAGRHELELEQETTARSTSACQTTSTRAEQEHNPCESQSTPH